MPMPMPLPLPLPMRRVSSRVGLCLVPVQSEAKEALIKGKFEQYVRASGDKLKFFQAEKLVCPAAAVLPEIYICAGGLEFS